MKKLLEKINRKNFFSDFLSEKFCLNRKNRILALFAIFAFAFSIRLARSFQLERVEKDGAQLLMMAQNIVDNGFSGAFIENPRLPPLYILLIAAAYRLGFNPESAGIFISVLSGALLVFPVYFIARRLFSKISYALISAVLIAVYPNISRVSAEVLRDPLSQILSVSALAAMVAGITSKKNFFFIFAGIFAALAAATRSEGIELLYALVIFLAAESVFRFSLKHKIKTILFENLRIFAIFAISFSVIVFPLEYALGNTQSQWSAYDKRAVNFLKAFFIKPVGEQHKKNKGGT